jgi:long-chain acyl-CoA synthetase
MLTHLNFMHATESNQSFEPRFPEDNMLSFAPLAWIAEHTLNVAPHCMLGIVINFPESPETVQQDIREIAPDVLFFPARLWENLTAMIQVGINDSTWVNRAIYKFFLPIGYKVADLKYENKPIPLPLALAHFIGDRIVFLPLRSQLGMHRVRTALTAGASLSPDMLRYFRAIGLNLKQVFATTETTAVGTQHWENDVNFASVGKPIPGVEVEIAEDGEIVMGGENIFHGYFKNDEATLSSLRVDETGRRWFMTGDAGYLDPNGHVIYLDRKKDLIQLAHGDRFSPQFIEGRLKFSPYIRDVMTVGHEAVEYVTALIAIDFDNVGRWAEKQSIPYTTFIDLAQKPEVYDLILADVRRVNETLPPTGQVKRFLLLHKDFDADEAEMTRTRKLRRRFLTERYSDLIRAMYDGKDSVAIRAEIVYQDGRSSVIETEVRIMSAVEEGVPV